MDFFRRHLNWTMGALWVVCWPLPLLASTVLAGETLAQILYYSFGFLILVFTTWYLRQKSRSEWWTFLWLPWFIASAVASESANPAVLAGILPAAPFLLILLKDRTWRPLVA